MTPIIHFQCRDCEGEVAIGPSAKPRVTCPHCKRELGVFVNDSLVRLGVVTMCVSCGHDTLYVQKDFNRAAGVGIVGFGVVLSIYFFARREPLFAMAALGLSALIDFLVYFLLREVTVCYSCHAVYRGFMRNPEHEPFDLKKLEKYGGRTPRGFPDVP